MRYLKQSTAVTVTVGPMIDEVDFITPITSVTHAGIVAGLIKGTTNGAITVTASAGVNDLVHILAGHHSLELTTGNTDTVGHLRIHLSDADSFLPVWEDFMVVEEQVFDSLHGAGDLLDVQVAGMDANVLTATAINADAITEAKIADNAIAAEHIASAAIVAATFAANAITSTVIADDAIAVGKIQTDAINADVLSADALVEIKTQATTALSDIDLDHLSNTATAIPAVTAGTFLDQMFDDGTATYDRTTDSLQAIKDGIPAQVNTEVLDVLQTDTFAQPGQEAPAASQSFLKMLQFLYKAWRNKSDQTASDYQLYNDDAAVVDQKASVTDDATTFTRSEIETGP